MDHDTAEFAVSTLLSWWRTMTARAARGAIVIHVAPRLR
jgi:hypothetical protein